MNKLEQVFVIKKQIAGLSRHNLISNHTSAKPRLNMQNIVNMLLANNHQKSHELMTLVNGNLHYRGLYKTALQHFCTWQSFPQVAANTLEVKERIADGFELKWIFDEHNDNQVYVVLKLNSEHSYTMSDTHQAREGIFLHTELADNFYMVYFRHTRENKYQLLTELDSRAFLTISNLESHLYIVSA